MHQARRRFAITLLSYLALVWSNAGQAEGPSFKQVKQDWRSSEAWLLDRRGQPLQRMRLDHQVRRLEWVSLEQVSPAFMRALIASEDKRFYQHSGIDWQALAGAMWRNIWNEKTRGASTLTMQLAGLLDPALQIKKGGRSLTQKWSQIGAARELDAHWRKDQILEAYLNLVSFRGELVGLDALSRGLFNKHPSGLNQREAALAVALIRAPNTGAPTVAKRACIILREQDAAAECAGLAGYTRLMFTLNNSITAQPNDAPHLARKLLATPGQRLKSTLDAPLQRYAQRVLTQHLAELRGRNVEDGALLILDNASGEVLAWVGSSGWLSDAAAVDGVTALRQAGSTLKPFLYELAIEQRLLTAASILNDTPVNITTSNGLYIPQNYDRQFKGPVSLRTALGSSLNIPAVRTLELTGTEPFFQRLKSLGFSGLKESGDYYGYSLALGSADINLLALTNAYRALARGGRYSPVQFRAGNRVAPQAVMHEGASFIISDILSDRAARAPTFGLNNSLATSFWSAVKTGTSKDMRDNWCVGFSSRYTVGVWVGNFGGSPMWDVSGVTGAAPVWREVMQYLHRDSPSRAPQAPKQAVMQTVRYSNRLEPERAEYFIPGTEQNLIEARSAQTPASFVRINYPGNGTLIALDPDIPPARQRILLQAQIGTNSKQTQWILDNRLVGTVNHPTTWQPWPGKHKLALRDTRGKLLDEIQFEVRGAWVKSAAAR